MFTEHPRLLEEGAMARLSGPLRDPSRHAVDAESAPHRPKPGRWLPGMEKVTGRSRRGKLKGPATRAPQAGL